MKRLTLAGAGLALAVMTLGAVRLGGWAVVTVEKIGDYLVVGKPTQLTFAVRQHGVTLMTDLSPTVVAKSGRREVTARAERLSTGGYRAELTVPEPGEWRISINSGFLKSRGELLPTRAIASTESALAPLPDRERGRMLFAAKGCVTCHVHADVDIRGEVADDGPDLSSKRFAAEYLAQFLADPSIKPQDAKSTARMPNLALKQADIAYLVAFINAERKTATR